MQSMRAALSRSCARIVRIGLLSPTLVLVCGDPPSTLIVAGDWGGAGIRLEVRGAGATLEFDCATGWWEERPALGQGDFAVDGTYAPERPGPIGEDDPPPPEWSVVYEGTVDGDRMRLGIRVPSQDLAIGPFELHRGAEGDLRKCL